MTRERFWKLVLLKLGCLDALSVNLIRYLDKKRKAEGEGDASFWRCLVPLIAPSAALMAEETGFRVWGVKK